MLRITYQNDEGTFALPPTGIVTIYRLGRMGPATRAGLGMPSDKVLSSMVRRGVLARRMETRAFLVDAFHQTPWRSALPALEHTYHLTPLGLSLYQRIEAAPDGPKFAHVEAHVVARICLLPATRGPTDRVLQRAPGAHQPVRALELDKRVVGHDLA